MKKISIFILLLNIFTINASEVLWNKVEKRSVLDLFTDPSAPKWKQITYLYDLCYKDISSKDALEKILEFKELGVLFYNDQEEQYLDSYVNSDSVLIVVYNDKIEESFKEEEHYIEECDF